jgi:hypothetical protein
VRTLPRSTKFSLNTYKSPNTKVVHSLKANNFAVDWHMKFEVNLGEKCVGTSTVPVHRRREKCQVGMQILPNPLSKTPIGLCES